MAANRKVYLAGINVSRWVNSVPVIVPSAGEYGQVTVTELPQFEGRDTTQFWDQRSQRSPFYGAPRLDAYPVRITMGSQTVFSGNVKGITSDGEKAMVTLQGALEKTLQGGLVYVGSNLTPAALAREILTRYGIAWDPASFASADAYYAANSVVCSIQQVYPNNTIMAALEAICQVGCARMYSVAGIVYFDVYRVRTSAPVVTFTDRRPSRLTLWSRPEVTAVEKDLTQGYVVTWTGPTVASFGPETGSRRTISAGLDALVQISSLQSAVWLGDLWYAYLNRPQQRVQFGVPTRIGKDVRLGFPVAVDYSVYPASITVDVVQIDPGNPLQTMITGLTR